MSDTPWKKDGIRRLDSADKNGIAEAEAFVRLAELGKFDWKEVGKNMLVDATSSAIAGGTIAGLGSGGALALPGALVGGLAGASFAPIAEATKEAIHWFRAPSDKAFAHAKELNDSVQAMGDFVAKADKRLGALIKATGNQYTDFVSAYIAKNQVNNIDKNVFNRSVEEIQNQFNQNINEARTGNSRKTFTRLANENVSSIRQVIQQGQKSDNHNLIQNVNDKAPVLELGGAIAGQNAAEKVFEQAIKGIGNPNILKSVFSLKSAGLDFVLNFGINAFLDYMNGLRGDLALFDDEMKKVKYSIEQINQLTNPDPNKNQAMADPQLVAAGNAVFSWLLEGRDRMKQILEQGESLAQEVKK